MTTKSCRAYVEDLEKEKSLRDVIGIRKISYDIKKALKNYPHMLNANL